MTDYALSHFIHLCRFIPTLELHLPYTAHWPRSETGVSNSNTYCQVSEYFFYWLGPYSSESELTASTGLAIVKRIHIRWGQDRLQCLNLEVRSENELQFLAICTWSRFLLHCTKSSCSTLSFSACGNSGLYHSTLWEFLVSKIELYCVLSLSSQHTHLPGKQLKNSIKEPMGNGLSKRITWDCQWLHLSYPWLPVRRMCPENCLGCMQESI